MKNLDALVVILTIQIFFTVSNAQSFTYYLAQSGVSFTNDVNSILYNVTAIAQTDQNGFGPAYFVQGLTDKGYWYQLGLGYDWFGSGKFTILYSVFSPTGSRLLNNSGFGYTLSKINPGDRVLLGIYLGNGNVYMYVNDYNTGAKYYINYTSSGATRFIGSPNGISNQNHFFTGLMTEWPYITPFSPSQTTVYSPYYSPQSPVRLWMYTLKNNIASGLISTQITSNFTSPISVPQNQNYFKLDNQSVSYYKSIFSTGIALFTPLSLSQSKISNATTDLGRSCNSTAYASIIGGRSPYIYNLYIDNLTTQSITSNNTNATFHPSCSDLLVGTHYYYLKITDANSNRTATQLGYLRINPLPKAISSLILPQNSFFFNNDSIRSAIILTNGTTPFNFKWYVNTNLALSTNSPNSTLYLGNGKNKLNLVIQDAAGANLTQSLTVITDYNYLHIWLVVIALLLLLLIILIRWYWYNKEEYYQNDGSQKSDDQSKPYLIEKANEKEFYESDFSKSVTEKNTSEKTGNTSYEKDTYGEKDTSEKSESEEDIPATKSKSESHEVEETKSDEANIQEESKTVNEDKATEIHEDQNYANSKIDESKTTESYTEQEKYTTTEQKVVSESYDSKQGLEENGEINPNKKEGEATETNNVEEKIEEQSDEPEPYQESVFSESSYTYSKDSEENPYVKPTQSKAKSTKKKPKANSKTSKNFTTRRVRKEQ